MLRQVLFTITRENVNSAVISLQLMSRADAWKAESAAIDAAAAIMIFFMIAIPYFCQRLSGAVEKYCATLYRNGWHMRLASRFCLLAYRQPSMSGVCVTAADAPIFADAACCGSPRNLIHNMLRRLDLFCRMPECLLP